MDTQTVSVMTNCVLKQKGLLPTVGKCLIYYVSYLIINIGV
jgi:hypothetical protein